MSLFALAGIARLLRSTMVEVLDSEYVKFARAKGIRERTVVWSHALRNSLVPVMSFAGIYISLMVGGAVVVETVFAWPGVGRLAYDGLTNRDYPMVQTVVLLTGTLIVFVNLITDVLYSVVDPRIKLG
jgi:ABC-type dipeptide/oligopeptide/nickel transport system permease component